MDAKDAEYRGRFETVLCGFSIAGSTWIAFALIELLLWSLWPLLVTSDAVLARWYWPSTLQLLALYAGAAVLAGLATGLAGAAFGSHTRRNALEGLASLTLVGAVAFNLLAFTKEALEAGIVLLLLAVTALALSAVFLSPRALLRSATSPMVTALVLATGLWLNYIVFREGPSWRRLLALAAVGIIILGLAVLRSRLPGRLGDAWKRFPTYGGLAALGLASWAGGVVFNHGLPPVPEPRASAAGRPNVVLVVLDATRADHFSTYGYQRHTTPNLKRFAREAAVFTNAFSASDMTLPGHASIFTGQFSEWHGAHYWPKHIGGRPLSSRYTTLAEVLSSYGYTTLAVGANSAYLQRHFGLDQGFQVYDVRPVVTVINHERPWALRNALVRLASFLIFLPELELASRRADEITDDALKLTGQVRANTPFFLFLNYMDTHTPYIPPSSYRGRFGGKEGRMTYRQYLALEHAVRRRRKSVSPAQQNFLAARYDEALAFADEQVGRLLNGLRKRGVYENSLIIVTSDHGEAFGEEGFLEHSAGSLRPSQLRIPLLVKLPNTNAAARESRFTSQVDIFPTVCRFTGAPLPHAAQGRSLFEAPQSRELYSSVFTPRPQGPLISRALFTLGKKLVVPWRGQPSLYDLQLDPAEKVDLAGRNGNDFAVLMTRMQAYKSRLPKHAGTAQVKIESNTVDQLRSLGYLQ